jgi:hypothetical protein
MKRTVIAISILFISVVFSAAARAQIVTITESEFETAGDLPGRPLDTTEHTERSVGTRFLLGKSTKTTEMTRQIDSKGNLRSFGKVTDDKTSETFERMEFKRKLYLLSYSRKNGGAWTVLDISCAVVFAPDEPEDLEVVYTLNSTDTGKLYTMTKEYTENGKRVFIVSKKFVNGAGYLIRTEFEQSEDSPDNFIYRSAADYEYSNGKIKIKKPNVK